MATLRGAIQKAAQNYRANLKSMSPFKQTLKSFNFKTGYYNQIGLLWHDIFPATPVNKEALRRLPREETEARDYRIARAFLLSGNKQILPENEWTKMEDDIPYLEPYIELIKKEARDKSDWEFFEEPKTYS